MDNFLVRYKIRTNRDATILANNYLSIYWDDVANDFVVHHFDDASDTTATIITSGPDLGADRFDHEAVTTVTPIPYSFCDGADLQTFKRSSLFPYATKVSTANHFSCASAVCDLQISDDFTITPASDFVTNDGAVEVSATSSNGAIKFSLDPNFDYASQGQASGLFSTQYAGTYTITAKDALGCVDQITITIPVPDTYGVLYRHEYQDLNGFTSRVDILERGYAGAVIEVDAGPDPFVLIVDKRTEANKFTPVAPSFAKLTLWSPSNFYFQDVFTQDDRKYQMKWYKNYGAGLELKWFGYVIPENYQEPYIKDPYPVTITATDGLADLTNFDFVDKDGNRYRDDITVLQAIVEILAKTDLKINIQSAINRFETGMNQLAADDPLPQCKFNPDTFYHKNNVSDCLTVLSEILKPFGGVIKQRLGKWFIFNPEELVGTAAYREFNHEGTFVTNSTVSDTVDINTATTAQRAVMQGGAQMLEVIPAYGKLFFEHTLLKWESLIQSYSFEDFDIYETPEGLKLFRNWNVNISNAAGATYGIKQTKAFEGDFNFFLKYLLLRNSGTTVSDGVSVLSAPITIEYENIDAFEYRFNYATLLSEGSFGQVYYTKIKWMLKVGSYYYNENGGWTTDVNQKYNEILVDRFNEVQEKKVTALLRDVAILTEETAQVEFILCNAYVYDFVDTTALKATPTTTKAIGTKMKVRVSSTLMHYYVLEEGTDAESLPDIVRPLDYAVTTNERIWVAEHLSVSSRGREVEYNFLDNVVLLHFPAGAHPPEDITIQRDNNAGIKINFEEKYLLNDIDLENINNSERTYKNYLKLLSGTPTQTWARTYRSGEGKLLELLSNDVVSQYKTPSNKITGTFLIDKEILPTTILKEVNDGDRKYMFMGYELHDKHAEIAFDIMELKDAVNPNSDAVDAGFTTGFSLGFRS